MSTFSTSLLVLIPLLPLVAGLAARRLGPAGAGRLTIGAAGLALAAAAWLAGHYWLAGAGSWSVRWSPFGTDHAFALALRWDLVSSVMVGLVSFLGAVILRFSRRYLAGDPGQARFFSWMSLTLGSVLGLVLAGQLLLLLAAWVAASLCLHRLLLHYPERSGAVFSARKKFVLSRAGDLCFLAAALVLYAHHRTFDIEALFTAVAAGRVEGLGLATLLLAGCAVLKSAQFPFHSWLPDTMEAPTPVSAFMHAGIVNAGGFLVVRLAPLFAAAPAALHVLAGIGAVTAAFGAIVMLAQPSVKRALAYSTIAQMGFMLLQCGLGAFGLALLHIVAHSLYKAHSFLTAGSTIGAVSRAAVPLRTPALVFGVLVGGLLVSFVATVIQIFAPGGGGSHGVFVVVLAIALAYGLARIWSSGGSSVLWRGVAGAAAFAALGLALHTGASALFAHLPAAQPPLLLVTAVGAVFAGLFLFQALLWRANRHELGRRLYVHALNAFYIGTWWNRFLGRLWPRQSVRV